MDLKKLFKKVFFMEPDIAKKVFFIAKNIFLKNIFLTRYSKEYIFYKKHVFSFWEPFSMIFNKN